MLTRVSVIKHCHDFICACAREGIFFDYAVLFGSYAHGVPHEYSDIDLCLVRSDFSGNLIKDSEAFRQVQYGLNKGEYVPFEFHTAPTDWFLHEERTFIKACVLPVGIFIPTVSAEQWAEIEAGRPYHPACDIGWKDIDDSPGTGVYDYPDGVPVPVVFPGRAERLERLRRKRERQAAFNS